MAHYHFETEWALTAPIDKVYETIASGERFDEWWPAVKKSELLEGGDRNGLGRRTAHTIQSPLFYRMRFDMKSIDVDPPRRARYLVRGDLIGTGVYSLEPTAGGTKVRFDWEVSTTKKWMNLAGHLTKPVFMWAHGFVMRQGAEAMATRLGATLMGVETGVLKGKRKALSSTTNEVEAN